MLQCSIPVDRMANGLLAQQSGELAPARGALISRSRLWALMIGSIGVVYGDIGTSPLYALRESVHAATGGGQTPLEPVILGILSLIIWALLLIVTVKYVLILLRADNDGEGGTLALMALANRGVGGKSFTSSCSASSAPHSSTATR